MKKFEPLKIVTKKTLVVKKQVIRLGEKTYKKTQEANVFFAGIGDFFMFFGQTIKETFSLNFEFKEFLRQCFQIGYKSLPLISVTGLIMGLVLKIGRASCRERV